MESQLSLYQIIHTLNGAIYHLEEHLELLFESYYNIFGVGAKLDREAIEKEIRELLYRARAPRGVSFFVLLTLLESGELQIREQGRSLYSGYTLRCVAPNAKLIEFNAPYLSMPTSLRHNLTLWANQVAQRSRCEVALRIAGECVDMINGSQIFAVSAAGIITSPNSYSVEHKLAKRAAHSLDINVVEREIFIEELSSLEELFFVDHWGVTPIKSCNGRAYMSITAGIVASEMARLETL